MKNKEVCSALGFLVVIILSLFLLSFVNASAPSSTMSAEISFNQTPLLNQNTELTVELLSIINATNTTANISLPLGIELISGLIQWNVSLIENVTSNHTIVIRINTTENFTIEIQARDSLNVSTFMGAKGWMETT